MKRKIVFDPSLTQPSKRAKIDRINAVKMPFIRSDDDDLCVYTNINCEFIKIGSYIYKVKPLDEQWTSEYDIEAEKAIGLTHAQHNEIDDYINSKKLAITSFSPAAENVKNIEKLTVRLGTTGDLTIRVKEDVMSKYILDILDGHIVTIDQSYPMHVGGMLIRISIDDIDKMSKGNVTKETKIEFGYCHSSIVVYHQCISLRSSAVKVYINQCTDISDHMDLGNQPISRFPLILDRKILDGYVREAFNDIFVDNQKEVYRKDNYEFDFNIKILNMDKHSKHKNIYQLNKDDKDIILVLSNIEYVMVTEETTTATKVCFGVMPFDYQNYIAEDYLLPKDNLVAFVKKNIKKVVVDQEFKYMVNRKLVKLPVNYLEPYSNKKTLYEINENTKIIFETSKDESNFIVVDNKEPYDLESIEFEIDDIANLLGGNLLSMLLGLNAKESEDEAKIIDSKKMVKIIRGLFPKKTAIGHRMIVPYKTFKCTVVVKETTFVDKKVAVKIKGKYKNCGLITEKTEIKINVADGNKTLIIDYNDGTGVIQDPVAELEKYVGGITDQIKEVVKVICLSRGRLKKEFQARKLKAPKGIIFYGIPGGGKTTIARNLGKLLGCTGERFKLMSGPEVFKKWVGSSEENVRKIFKPAEDAYKKNGIDAPTYMVAIDEIDAMLPSRTGSDNHPTRDSVVNQFLAKMDGLEEIPNIILIGMTNRLELIDPAALRAGRFGTHIKIDVPDHKGRLKIFEIHTKTLKEIGRLDNINFAKLVDMTNDFTGADIENAVGMASLASLERLDKLEEINDEVIEKHGKITEKDFVKAIQEIATEKNKGLGAAKHMYS